MPTDQFKIAKRVNRKLAYEVLVTEKRDDKELFYSIEFIRPEGFVTYNQIPPRMDMRYDVESGELRFDCPGMEDFGEMEQYLSDKINSRNN